MEDQLITFGTAKLAKDKGFNIPVCNYYNIQEPNKLVTTGAFNYNFKRHGNVTISAPTQSLLQKWLREKHDIHVFCVTDSSSLKGYYFVRNGHLDKNAEYHDIVEGEGNLSYEEALEEGLREALIRM